MPRFPTTDPVIDQLPGSVFTALAPRIASLEGEVYPLHAGDTWLEPDPAFDCRAVDTVESVRPHRYSNPHGIPPLLRALVDKIRARNRIPVEGTDNVLVTVGATGALHAAVTATISAGDEALLLAPSWPFIRGAVVLAGGVPVEVPLVAESPDAELVRSALEEKLTKRTAAVYLNTPCNPTGWVFGSPVLEAIADFARTHGLWIWSDEVYEDYAYSGRHRSIAELAPERTLTAFSFSKAYGVAGYRCGYLVGPREPVVAARRAAAYVWYSVPTPSQLAGVRALEFGAAWLERARESYRKAGGEAADRLGVPRPEGGTFLFLDVAPHLDERGLAGFLEDCLDDNLVLTPGTSFGINFDTWVRLCFTCVEPDVVMRGVDRLARRLGR
jgi:N-succinyldiaminopimelate aminotransferase